MNTKKLDLNIYRTNDYSMFKTLKGNREVKDNRVGKIIESINKVGYILNPIIINENGEVIDGQGRLEALKQLNLPVDYVVSPGASIDECIAMNIHQTNWGLTDYMKSYVEQENENYIRLSELMAEFPEFDFRSCLAVVLANPDTIAKSIQCGTLQFTEEDMTEARLRLAYISPFLPHICKNGGRKHIFCCALSWACKNVKFDRDRLFLKIKNNSEVLPPMANVMFAMQHFEKLYNQGLGGKSRVYFASEYDKHRAKSHH